MPKTLCIDFDDTIRGRNDSPLPGAADALRQFKQQGHRILISSARLDPITWGDLLPHRIKEIKDWLNINNIPHDDVVAYKPVADIYIDDRGFRFEGQWPAAVEAIERILCK